MAIVEAALLSPLFFLLLLALMEYSLAFKDYLSVNNAAHDAARAATTTAGETFADYDILQVVKRNLSALDRVVDRVVVFKASTRTDSVPPACMTVAIVGAPSGVAGVCNAYGPDALTQPPTKFGFHAAFRNDLTLLDRFWPVHDRIDADAIEQFVGVTIQATHQGVTGMFGGDRVIRVTVVMPFEVRRG